MKYVMRRYNRGITNPELIADLRRVAQKLGKKTVRFTEYDREGCGCAATFVRRFGSWNKAQQAAGLEVEYRYKIPTEELFKNLARVWGALGRQPVNADMVRPLSACTTDPYMRRFGGWRQALKAFIAWADEGNVPQDADEPPPPQPRRTPRTPNPSLRYAVLERDFFTCQACGRSPRTHRGTRLHLDHKIPWKLGGPTTLENLTTLCQKCNWGKGSSNPYFSSPRKRAPLRNAKRDGESAKG